MSEDLDPMLGFIPSLHPSLPVNVVHERVMKACDARKGDAGAGTPATAVCV